jgi:DNA-binding ferritin-like protein
MTFMTTISSRQKNISSIIVDMLFYVNQLHLAHWLTLKNHHHVVVGELYEELEEELDELAEQYLGASLPELKPEEALDMAIATKKQRTYKVIKSTEDILDFVEEVTQQANMLLSLVEEDKKYSFLRDSTMDIIAVLHSAKYQITQE